jgi:hypothetical protein
MSEIADIMERYNFSSKMQKPINDFSNWLFTIAIGLFAFFIGGFEKVLSVDNSWINIFFLFLSISNMLNVLLSGYIKYLIINREIKMNQYEGQLNKAIFFTKRNKESDEVYLANVVHEHSSKWMKESDKISSIGKLFNISIILTLLNVVASGLFTFVLFVMAIK